MVTKELPKVYRGYSTAELLALLDKISGGVKEESNNPPEMMIALAALAHEFKLTPEARIGDLTMRRSHERSTADK
ncbi:MAG: hypothetical protein LIQ31_09140 [Planctomycetes bacterium]|nr:hypothetical protein [Planctomycetota bacterium]